MRDKIKDAIAVISIGIILGVAIVLTARNNYEKGVLHGRQECEIRACFE